MKVLRDLEHVDSNIGISLTHLMSSVPESHNRHTLQHRAQDEGHLRQDPMARRPDGAHRGQPRRRPPGGPAGVGEPPAGADASAKCQRYVSSLPTSRCGKGSFEHVLFDFFCEMNFFVFFFLSRFLSFICHDAWVGVHPCAAFTPPPTGAAAYDQFLLYVDHCFAIRGQGTVLTIQSLSYWPTPPRG